MIVSIPNDLNKFYANPDPNFAEQKLANLEEKYFEKCFKKPNINPTQSVINTFAPTEEFSEKIQKHLRPAKKGIIISQGTERSFLNLIFSNNQCQGLVILDTNPYSKLYFDFSIALIKISRDVNDYERYSFVLQKSNVDLIQKIEIIKQKILQSSLPQEARDYYLANLPDMAKTYYEANYSWKSDERFKACHYFKNKKQFLKLQKFALSGSIVCLVQKINKLSIFEKEISVIDLTSSKLEFFRPELQKKSYPIIIQAFRTMKKETNPFRKSKFKLGNTFYLSYRYDLSEKNRLKYDRLLDVLKNSRLYDHPISVLFFGREKNEFQKPVYTQKTLTYLENFVSDTIIKIPEMDAVDVTADLDRVPQKTLATLLLDEKYQIIFSKNLFSITSCWTYIEAGHLLLLNKLKGFNDFLEINIYTYCVIYSGVEEFDKFLLQLHEKGLFNKFAHSFGLDKIENLRNNIVDCPFYPTHKTNLDHIFKTIYNYGNGENFKNILKKLKKYELLGEFVEVFGKDRLEDLKKTLLVHCKDQDQDLLVSLSEKDKLKVGE